MRRLQLCSSGPWCVVVDSAGGCRFSVEARKYVGVHGHDFSWFGHKNSRTVTYRLHPAATQSAITLRGQRLSIQLTSNGYDLYRPFQ